MPGDIPSIKSSGEGSRPSTDGGVDNMGAASGFTPGQVKPADGDAPAGYEKMSEKRRNKTAVKGADAAPFLLRERVGNDPSAEPPVHKSGKG